MKSFLPVLALLSSVCVASAHAAPVTLTFTGLQNGESVANFYNGGTGSKGSSGGVDAGVSFGSGFLALVSAKSGGTGEFDNVPAPGSSTILYFLSGPGDTMNVAAGFTQSLSFDYASPNDSGIVDIYSGLDGTGALLAQDTLARTPSGCDPAYVFSCWVSSSASFTGTAQSAVFSGTANQVAFADVTLGAPIPALPTTPTPEPATLLMVGSGLLGLARTIRRRTA